MTEKLRKESSWSKDFGMMLGCSVAIAAYGLILGSPAVIIGAMLLAPLMTPLLAIGYALIQGNFQLLGRASQALLIGTLIGFVVGGVTQFIVPGSELSQEVLNRGGVNLLDLLIAFTAGVAAGYALVRPQVSSALPGVAIAVALVPPLAASGIALAASSLWVCLGAIMLYGTNLLAIVLGAALMFWAHGIRLRDHSPRWVFFQRILLVLVVLALVLIAPLGWSLLEQIRQGMDKPASLTLPEPVWAELDARVDEEEGIDFLTGARAGSRGPEDVTLILTSYRPVPMRLVEDLDEIINRRMGRKIEVKITVLQPGRFEDGQDDPVVTRE